VFGIGSKWHQEYGNEGDDFSSRRLVSGVIGPISNRAQVEGDENTFSG